MPSINVTVFVYSYCGDLTDPDAVSYPVGVLGFGGINGQVFWSHVNISDAAKRYCNGDVFHESIMKDLPGWFAEVLHDIMNMKAKTTSEILEHIFAQTGAGNFHASDMFGIDIDYPDGDDPGEAVLEAMQATLKGLHEDVEAVEDLGECDVGFYSEYKEEVKPKMMN